MSQISVYLQNALVNHVFRNSALTSPTTVYLALYTVDPGDADSGTEVTGGSYARQSITFGAPTLGVTSSVGNITFPTATAPWGTVVAIGVRDDVTGGNLLVHGLLSPQVTINTNDIFQVLSGSLTVQMT